MIYSNNGEVLSSIDFLFRSFSEASIIDGLTFDNINGIEKIAIGLNYQCSDYVFLNKISVILGALSIKIEGFICSKEVDRDENVTRDLWGLEEDFWLEVEERINENPRVLASFDLIDGLSIRFLNDANIYSLCITIVNVIKDVSHDFSDKFNEN
ncbi:hypothetical protein [Deinococcus hopiensis]|uniref:hypothetical protein n=1 Tax=Deinococcus hopiensis TaxID=309885 RepID=UPI00111C4BFE|nr:hypothetical protein [Deinococcus hopiensis]